jgi:hypothetical protein
MHSLDGRSHGNVVASARDCYLYIRLIVVAIYIGLLLAFAALTVEKTLENGYGVPGGTCV